MLRKLLLGVALTILCFTGTGVWIANSIQSSELANLADTTPDELAYLDSKVTSSRGKILVVVTSTGEILNDPVARNKVINSIALASIDCDEYAAVYFVGGKGAMWDFPDNEAIQNLVRHFHHKDKVTGAICHGPAALVNVKLDGGEPFLAGKQVSGFSNDEELFLMPDARAIFPFMLEDRLHARGATVQTGPSYLEQIRRDGICEQHSYRDALAQLEFLAGRPDAPFNHQLIAMHSLVAAMKLELLKAFELIRLASGARQLRDRL